jgi:hypothetical protein
MVVGWTERRAPGSSRLAGLCLTLALLTPGVSGGDAVQSEVTPGVIAHILSFQDPENVLWRRRGDSRPLVYYGGVEVGDDISVLSKVGSVTLLVGGKNVRVTQSAPYVGVYSGEVPSILKNVFKSISALFSAHPAQSDNGTVEAVTRSLDEDELALPGVLAGRSALSAGLQDFALKWWGGQSPYHIEITPSSDEEVAKPVLDETTHRTTGSWTVDLAPGPYRLVVSDGQGACATAEFEVLPASHLYLPEELLVDGLDEDDRLVVKAVWLAGTEGGRWRFEAYQLLMRAPGAHSPTQQMLSLMEQGYLPEVRWNE